VNGLTRDFEAKLVTSEALDQVRTRSSKSLSTAPIWMRIHVTAYLSVRRMNWLIIRALSLVDRSRNG
jgi:hypothetical protein